MSLKKILANQRGVALLMIMTAILFLTVIYGDFTFESKISRLKATNILDRSQAKLLAESGLQMAMTRLRLYKEAFNKIQSNDNLKQAVPAQLLNQLWEVPYIYPIPVGEGANRALKDTVAKFQKESIVDGEIRVTVQNLSNRLNLNLLRYDMQKIAAEAAANNANHDANDPYHDTTNNYSNTDSFSVDQALFTSMKRLVDEKKEKDDAFRDKYGNLDYRDLFTNLKYYMSDFGTSNRDPLFGEAEQTFQRAPLTPKFGPMTSTSELYAVPGWDDQLIALIQNEFSVYPTTQIDLNKITVNFLKIMFPGQRPEAYDEFFKYRDDPNNPKFFNSVGDFKKFVVDLENWVTSSQFDDKIALFQKKGITFGSNPNLFKVVCEGIFNRATYTLVATVVLPKQESAGGQPANNQQPPGNNNQPGQPPATQPGTQPGNNTANQTAQLLEPRIIEIQIN